MKYQKVTLIETPQGFLWAERGVYYKSLATARRALTRDAKRVAKSPAAKGKVATLLEIY
jgi:hypothetical protein